MRILGILVVVVALLLAGAYFGSPYWAVYRLQSAATEGDAERVARYVDIPAVRKDIMTQLQAIMTKQAGPSNRHGNPFAGRLAGATATMLFEAMASPEGVANMVSRAQPRPPKSQTANASPSTPSADSIPPPRMERAYEGLGVFTVKMHDPRTDAPIITLVLDRDGWVDWKMRTVRLDALNDKK